jgi:integrase/recombinase XerD
LVARASRRCSLGTIYAHRLRHTAATTMLHAGASLEGIGQVLRHRHALTTAGYAHLLGRRDITEATRWATRAMDRPFKILKLTS